MGVKKYTARKDIERLKKQDELEQLIKLCCELTNEDPEFAAEYLAERMEALKDNLDVGIDCFKRVAAQFTKETRITVPTR